MWTAVTCGTVAAILSTAAQVRKGAEVVDSVIIVEQLSVEVLKLHDHRVKNCSRTDGVSDGTERSTSSRI